MRGVTFTWKEIVNGIPQATNDLPTTGFIAQEVEEVFPQVIGLLGEFKTLDYPLLIAAITEALQQQNKIIVQKGEELSELERIVKEKGLL